MKRLILVGIALQMALQTPAFAESQSTNATLFRDIFAKVSGANSEDQLNHLIYLPSEQMLNERSFLAQDCTINPNSNVRERSSRQMLCQMKKSYSQINAKDLFELGAMATKQQSNSNLNLDALNDNLRNKELTIVILPGIFGEFIKGRAFEEVFPTKNASGGYDNDSAAAREWRKALSAKAQNCATATSETVACAEQEQLKRVNLEPGNRGQALVPMEQLMNVGSMDDEMGRPLVRVVLFQMDAMTLESLSTQQKNAAIFMKRLEKYFEIMGGAPKNIAFLGYSRGTDFALELVSQAQEQRKPWLNNVKGLVSLGGVVFGSALADEAINNKQSALAQQLRLVNSLKASLTPLPAVDKGLLNLSTNAEWLALNTLGWWKFATAMAKLQNIDLKEVLKSGVQNLPQLVQKLVANGGGADPAFGIKLLVQASMKFGLINGELLEDEVDKLYAAIAKALNNDLAPLVKFVIDHTPHSDNSQVNAWTLKYNTDISRFKRLATAAEQGVTELTTDSRLAWWRTHNVPTNIRYYSVSGTMADPTTSLGNNRWAYNPGSPDDTGLVQNWRDFQNVKISGEYEGVSLNDSQVAIYKTMFWPQMIASLNPFNRGIRATPLAVFGTHHWGLALPIVTEVSKLPGNSNSGLMKTNPFPRTAVMYSIALSIANDIQADTEKGQ